MTKKDKTYELIVKKLMEEISEDENQLLNEKMQPNKSLTRGYISLFTFWKNFFPKKQEHNIIQRTEKKLGITYRLNSKTNKFGWLKIAASILLVLSLSFSIYQIVKPKVHVTLNEYTCEAGKVREITLSDGTKVWLNSSSLLMASEPFVGDTREVSLFGEGYFEVAHNEEQPFIVKTVQLKTKVLGTHFNVVAHPTDEVHEISLYQGKIQLLPENNDNTAILAPGERAYFTVNSGKMKLVSTDLGKPAKWRDGILRFYDEDLFSITKKLERKFHTRIFIADSIVGNLKYTAEFEEESLEMIMKILCEAQAFKYDFTNNGVFIQKKRK